jgi:hypothetical protein
MEEQRRGAIRDAFYVNQLMMQSGPQMTATEVVQRNEEKMRLLGPVLGRLQSELLRPLIDRTFAILLRKIYLNQHQISYLVKIYKLNMYHHLLKHKDLLSYNLLCELLKSLDH